MITMLARRNFFNDFMSDPFDFGFFGTEPAPKANASLMKTDVKETDKAYELDIDLPGFDKENVQIELNDGYLTINASTNKEKEDKDENGHLPSQGALRWFMPPQLLRWRRRFRRRHYRQVRKRHLEHQGTQEGTAQA